MTQRESKLIYFCPYCRRIFRRETIVCPNCHGTVIVENASLCPACRRTLPNGALTCPSCNRPVIDSLISTNPTLRGTSASNPTSLWHLVAFLFGLLGGLIGYIAVKNRNDIMAIRLIVVGTAMTAVDIALYLMYPHLLF